MRTPTYPSDMTDTQWALIEPLIPVYRMGRKRNVQMRDVVDGIFYINRTGCQWRMLPADFPPRSTVHEYYTQWRRNGTLDRIHDTLREKVRKKEKPDPTRHTASIDSQSVDSSSGGEQTGRDNYKKVDGRKRHIVIDSLGLLLAVVITAADVDDATGAQLVLAELKKSDHPELKWVFCDSKYHNHDLNEFVEGQEFYKLWVVRRPPDTKGWVVLPKRWMVERTFAWLQKCRRLSIDREKTTNSSRAMVQLAMIHLMLNRLDPAMKKQEFHYQKVA